MACIAAAVLGTRNEAEDLVQQAIAIAIEKNPKFDEPSKFEAWLAGIVRNCALNHRRKRKRRRTYPTAPERLRESKQTSDISHPLDSQTGQVLPLQTNFDDDVLRALQLLTDQARACLLLRVVEGMSYDEISNLLGIPTGTAMNLVFRAKNKLREQLSGSSKSASLKNEGGEAP